MPGQRALFLSRRPIHLDVKRYRYPMGWKSEKLNPECSKARFPDVPDECPTKCVSLCYILYQYCDKTRSAEVHKPRGVLYLQRGRNGAVL